MKNHHWHPAPTHPSTHTHTYTNGYETGSSWHVQINQKAWQKRGVFSLALKLQREGEALRSAGSEFQAEQCNQKNIYWRFSSLSLEFGAVVLSKNKGSAMVDMCREKKTGMAEECHRSDGQQALWACTECSILLGARGILSKAVWHDHASNFWRWATC